MLFVKHLIENIYYRYKKYYLTSESSAAKIRSEVLINVEEEKMLKHIVLLKFKDSVTAEQITDLKNSLLALPQILKEIKGYECGSDLRPAKTFDFVLVSTFDDFAALKRYQVYPEHVDVLTKVRNLSAKIEVADFEY
jgi:hypothetical protein